MLNPVKQWRHLAVAASLVAAPGLAAVGLLGGGIYEERFEAKQIVVMPDGADGVRITEIVDDDFGTTKRHGYERLFPNDFGEPQDVEARTSNGAMSCERSCTVASVREAITPFIAATYGSRVPKSVVSVIIGWVRDGIG